MNINEIKSLNSLSATTSMNSVNQLYNKKIQDINSRISDISVSNKFQSCLEKANLKTSEAESSNVKNVAESKSSSLTDTDNLISTLLTSSLNSSTSSLLSSAYSSDNSLFPTSSMNNPLQVLQQSALLKSLTSKSEK